MKLIKRASNTSGTLKTVAVEGVVSAGPGRLIDKRCAGGGASLGGQCALSYTRQITEGSESYRGRHSPSGGRDEFPGNVLVDSHTRTSGAGAAFSAAGTQRRPPPIILVMCRKAGFQLTFHASQARVSNHGARDISLALCRKAGPSYPDSNAGARVKIIPIIKHVARAIFHLRCIQQSLLLFLSSAHRKRSRPVLPLLWRGRHTLEVSQ